MGNFIQIHTKMLMGFHKDISNWCGELTLRLEKWQSRKNQNWQMRSSLASALQANIHSSQSSCNISIQTGQADPKGTSIYPALNVHSNSEDVWAALSAKWFANCSQRGTKDSILPPWGPRCSSSFTFVSYKQNFFKLEGGNIKPRSQNIISRRNVFLDVGTESEGINSLQVRERETERDSFHLLTFTFSLRTIKMETWSRQCGYNCSMGKQMHVFLW